MTKRGHRSQTTSTSTTRNKQRNIDRQYFVFQVCLSSEPLRGPCILRPNHKCSLRTRYLYCGDLSGQGALKAPLQRTGFVDILPSIQEWAKYDGTRGPTNTYLRVHPATYCHICFEVKNEALFFCLFVWNRHQRSCAERFLVRFRRAWCATQPA